MTDDVLSIANEFGKVAVWGISKRYAHVSGLRLQPLCRKLKIKYAPALVGWGGTKRSPKPIVDGVVVSARSVKKLLAAIEERERRSSPEKREQSRLAAEVRRKRADAARQAEFAANIRTRFPACTQGEEFKIAAHACAVDSGRVGRSTTAEDPVLTGVVAWIRHQFTDYDDLLPNRVQGFVEEGLSREAARSRIARDANPTGMAEYNSNSRVTTHYGAPRGRKERQVLNRPHMRRPFLSRGIRKGRIVVTTRPIDSRPKQRAKLVLRQMIRLGSIGQTDGSHE